MSRKYFQIAFWILTLAGLGYIAYLHFFTPPELVIVFQNESVREASLFKEVSATGTINPIDVVEVGTQVSGNISEIFVDFNSRVKKGQVIAKMDMRNLNTMLEESQANLAKAEMTSAQAERDMNRMVRLVAKGAVTGVDAERATDAYKVALENQRLAQLQVDKNRVNLSYATIISPIDGVIISRSIDVGQTVAASFSTPTLFRIANDLSKMKIEASVDEADIGQVKPGQKTEFTVDTYAGETFFGKVEELQLQPIVAQNVVTYKVIILIDNPDDKLLPGMTATLIIKTEESPMALTVPNSAFDFKPSSENNAVLMKKGYRVFPADQSIKHTLWVQESMKIIEKPVKRGFTNGFRTVVELADGTLDSVLTNLSIEEAKGPSGNLFMVSQESTDD